MKLIPHHQGDKHGHREYRSPDGTWKGRADPPPRRQPGPYHLFLLLKDLRQC